MRLLLVFILSLLLFVPPATAQAPAGKTKTTTARTFVETLDMSSGLATVQGFIDAYAASNYITAYYLLSPPAKIAFSDQVNSFNAARLFPKLTGVAPPGSVFSTRPVVQDMIDDKIMDGALIFDDIMLAAERNSMLPFDLRNASAPSATIDRADQARYMVATQGDPSFVVISAVRLSNGEWRVDRIVWAASDPEARPWDKK